MLSRPWLTLLNVVISAHLACDVSAIDVTLQQNPNIVGVSSAVISVSLVPELQVPAGGGFRITLPTEFQSGDLGCKVVEPQSINVLSCSLESTKDALMTISGTIPAFAAVYLEVNRAASPASTALNKDYNVSSFDERGITLETSGNLSLVQFQPATLTDFAFEPQSSDFGAQTSVDIQITAGVEVPCAADRSGCYLTIEAPVLNAYSASRDRDLVFDEELLSCEAISQSQTATEIACKIIDDQYLEIAELSDGPIAAGSSFTVRVHGFNNPLFPQAIDGFQMSTVDELGGTIEQTSQFSVTASTPAPITDLSLRLAPNSDTSSNAVLQKSELLLDFAVPVPLETGCLIYIQVPAEFTRLYQEMKQVQVYGMFGNIRSLPFSVLANNMVEIRDACTSYTENQLWAKVRLRSVVNPSSVRTTYPFVIKVKNKAKIVIAQTQSSDAENLALNASSFAPGSIQEFRLLPSNPLIQEKSSLEISFQTTNSLSWEAIVVVTFPETMSLASSCQAQPRSTVTISPSMACTTRPADNKILLKQLFQSFGYNPESDGVLSIDFKDIIERNPTSVEPEMTFTIQTYDKFNGAYSSVDALELLLSDFTQAGVLSEVNLTFDKSESNHFPANATIDFLVAHETLLKDSAVQITFPPDFRFAQSQIKVGALKSFTSQAPSFSFSGANTILIEDLSQLESGDRVSFTISSIRLPRYQGLVLDPIQIAVIVTSTGYPIDKTELQYFVFEATRWDSVSLSLSSLQNLASTELQIDFTKNQTGLLIDPYDVLVLNLPKDIQIDRKILNCRLDDVQHTCLLEKDANSLTVTQLVAQAADIGTLGTLSLSVDGLLNPKSTRPLSSLSFSLKDSQSRVVVTGGETMTWSTTEPAELKVKLVQDSTSPQALTTYRLSPIAPLTDLASSHAIVAFPACIKLDTDVLKVEDSSGQSLQIFSEEDTNLIKIWSSWLTPLKEIVLKGITNPTEKCLLSAESGIRVETYDDNTFEFIQGVHTLQPSLGCIDSCLGCLSTDTTVCTSCSEGKFLTEDGQCVKECPGGAISDAVQGTCVLCAPECTSCKDSADFCLACSDPFKVASGQGTCIEEASCKRDGFYVSQVDEGGTLCLSCSAGCLACEGSAETCTACPDNLYLYDGSCYLACGDGLDSVSFDSIGNVCEQNTLLDVIASLSLDLKCSYALVLTVVLFAIVKLTCKREMSLLVSIVVTSANLETIALLLATYQAFSTSKETRDDPEGSSGDLTLQMYGPIGLLALFLVFNICVTVRFFAALSKRYEDEEGGDAEVSRQEWSNKAFSCSRISCMVTSLLLSFHNTAWLNISGQLPLPLKKRLFMNNFTQSYARISKLTISMPKLALQAYGVYFGVFAAEVIDERETQMCVLDLTLVSFAQTFMLLLAMNFQWTMTTMDSSAASADHDDTLIKTSTQGVIQTRNSLELHNLRLSRADLTEIALVLQKQRKTMVVKDAADLKLLFQAENIQTIKRRSLQLQQRNKDERGSKDLSPQKDQQHPRQSLDRSQLSLSVFKRVTQKLSEKSRFNVYSRKSNSTPAPQKTPKVQQELRPAKQISLDMLSDTHVAAIHEKIDRTFIRTKTDQESDVLDQGTSHDTELGRSGIGLIPSRGGPLRNFSHDHGDGEVGTTHDDTAAYSSNEKVTAWPLKSPPVKRKSKKSSVLMSSAFSSKLNNMLKKQKVDKASRD